MFYRKIGNVRIAMVGIFILGGMAIYNYTSRNKRIRINNS